MTAIGRGGLRCLLVLAALAPSLSACTSSEPETDLSTSQAVEFAASDGVVLQGRVFGDGDPAVVLSHMRAADQTSWYRFAERLAEAGYTVLTFNFRGTCPGGDGGCSQGEPDIGAIWQDVVGAVDFVRGRGARSVSLVGASMGGTASLVAAAQGGIDVEAIVTLSAPAAIEGLVVDGAMLSGVSAGKLFIAGVGDAAAARDAQELHDRSPPPKRLEIVPADDHGTELLSGAQAEVVRRLIENYLAQFAGP